MGKRFFDFCKNGPQIFKKIAIHSSFGFVEPFLGEKKRKEIDPPKKIWTPYESIHFEVERGKKEYYFVEPVTSQNYLQSFFCLSVSMN